MLTLLLGKSNIWLHGVGVGQVKFSQIAGVGCFVVACGSAQAQGPMVFSDELLLSLSTGTEQSVERAPSVATVITADLIRDMGATTMSQVLDTVPGLHVYPIYLTGMQAAYSIRGVHSSIGAEVLMLRNGIPIQQPSSGGRYNIFELPVHDIERIEVIRGPGSAVHGSEAFAGVINIITKDARSQGTQAGAISGSFDSHEVWLQHSDSLGKLDYRFNFEYTTTDGDPDRILNADLQTGLDPAFNSQASQAPGVMPTDKKYLNTSLVMAYKEWQVELWHWQVDESSMGPNATLALDSQGVGFDEYRALQLDVKHQHRYDDHWQFDSRYAFSEQQLVRHIVLFPPGAVLPINSDGNLDFKSPVGLVSFPDGMRGTPSGDIYNNLLDFSAIYSGFDEHRLRLGIGGNSTRFYSFGQKNFGPGVIDGTQPVVDGTLTYVDTAPGHFYDEAHKTRHRWYLSLQDEWQISPDWAFTGGVRYDHYSDFGDTTNPRLALVWATRHNLTTKMLYGKAFRAPSMNELYLRANPVNWGNSNLQPVTIDTVELVFDYDPTFDISTHLNLYYYEIEDAITYVLTDPTQNLSVAQNLGGQRGRGLEFDVQWQVSKRLQLDGSLALQDAELTLTHQHVPEAPRKQAFLAGLWRIAHPWSLYGQIKWIDDLPRAAADSRPQLAGHALINASLRYSPEPWQFAVLVKNLADKQAYDPSSGSIAEDFLKEGRSLALELRWDF